ncbi:Metallo-dependent phosphatase-like protein [Leucosporidium creatinivorum]|uniref:Metallo-dependent phosphatase-like protein n=1 Tax=Leucosporidium creatinivorum TaxID=106004 RepID=A0A1Y2E2F6_9BASI|nr:Metallo-dependent phosphatase-like protein [Leucosporidium creatinivorum]
MPPTPRSNSNSLGLGRPILFCILILFTFLYLIRTPSAAPTPQSSPKKQPLAAPVAQQEQDGIHRQRIIGLADIHGDLPAMTSILRRMKLVDMRGEWIGGNAVIVQTGDLVDRGPALIAITRFWDTLRPQAEKAGGGVVNLLGNHEIMNALGDWRYVTKEDIASFGGERQRRAALSTGFIGQTWRHNYSITARVPFTQSFTSLPSSLTPTLPKTPRGSSSQLFLGDPTPPPASEDPFSHAAASFVHGGITPEYLSSLASEHPISKINALGSSILYSLLDTPAPLSLPRGSTEEQREFWSERGPMWNREYALDEDEDSICERAEKACRMLGVRRLIMGHTPHFGGIVSRCDGKILLIDTGISRAYGGAHSALEILYTLTPVEDSSEESSAFGSSKTSTKWIENEVVSAMYTGDRETVVLATSEREVEIPAA